MSVKNNYSFQTIILLLVDVETCSNTADPVIAMFAVASLNVSLSI